MDQLELKNAKAKEEIDFILCIGDDTPDEPMFKEILERPKRKQRKEIQVQ